jgi:hypothetical protein
MLLLTSDWPRYHLHIDILFADGRIHPSALASSCVPSSHLSAYSFCLLADPLGFEDPPSGIPGPKRTCCWLDIIAVTECFRRCVCPTLYLLCALRRPGSTLTHVPPLHLRTQLLPWTVWIARGPLSPLSSWVLTL